MRKTVHKLFWIWELPKEEAWINEMAEHGYGLVDVGRFRFEFEDIEPDKYRYKSLFLKGSYTSTKIRDFLKFMEEMGIMNVGHVSYLGRTCVYLRYENTGEELEVFSDLDSKIEYEKTLFTYLIFAGSLNLFAWIYNMAIFIMNCFRGEPTYYSLLCFLNFGIGIGIVIAIIRINRKIKKLTREREIHE